MSIYGLRTGVMKAGNWGFTPYRPSRANNPVAFWFFCLMYLGAGLGLTGYSAAIFLDVAQPPQSVRRTR
jgi:hypothetical protein